ncbi:YvrJ-like protein [Scopulibacillus darangshiensis]|uniref:YvrJ-like protein n=1 Tax=Scopulibacillus darangshiensis TaxID=442528 RepID=A0A4R2P522_9BACL|nr:YvrJ family protein [Scopulibacillus darangshiensis]TCP29767.1 YvrJ-like protein [Scopulibacillus darangshiensis]
MGEWLAMVKDVGFPIVVTLYLLHRIEGKLDEVNQSIQKLAFPLSRQDHPPSLDTMAQAGNERR